jgi:hypothetical protein
MIRLVKGNTAFGLLWLELIKLAKQALQLVAGLFLLVAVLNTSLGAAVVLRETTQSISTSNLSAGFSEPSTGLVHLQLFGGLVHLHEHEDSNHQHFSNGYQPSAGVTEFLVAENDLSNYNLSTYSSVPSFGKIDYTSGWSQNALFALLSALALLIFKSSSGRLSRYNHLLPDNSQFKRLDRPPIPL